LSFVELPYEHLSKRPGRITIHSGYTKPKKFPTLYS